MSKLRTGSSRAAIAVAALCLAACSGSRPVGSTLRTTYNDPAGTGALRRAPGEHMINRTDLAPASRPVRPLAMFGFLADAHIRDTESPARVPFLDRIGPPFESTFRPQEALTTQVLADTVRSLNTLPLQAVVEGGDLIDNAQANEMANGLSVLRGGVVHPDSGSPGYTGVQAAGDPDPFYYRPDLDAPRHPGLLSRAMHPFASPGLRAPWYPVVGNHDLLVQGELAPTPATRAAAVGSRRLLELRDAGALGARGAIAPQEIEALLRGGLVGPSARVSPDPRRRELRAHEALRRLIDGSGHGSEIGGLLDYAFDIGPHLRAIALDTVERTYGSEGIVRRSQLRWLRGQLAAAKGRSVVIFSHQPLARSRRGAETLRLLDRYRNVIAAIAGHTHRNKIVPRRTAVGGYWLITSASLADYPQQARAFELVETASHRIALETWMVDHTNDNDGGLARELAYLDAQGGRPNDFAGRRLDRNVRLYVPATAP